MNTGTHGQKPTGFTVAVWLTSEGHIPNAKQEAVLCIAYVSTRDGAARMEDRACPPSAGSSLAKEYVTLDG
ncbi:hypothetical protein [Amycolatopsis sp. NPDC051372]|uniref:hypothetical protein n=1 Tax=unclassified Amycolatopsis TaxID=2618356 RepID=UPI00341FB0C3